MLKVGDTSWGRKEIDLTTQSKIQDLKQQGKSIRTIANELKLSKTTVL